MFTTNTQSFPSLSTVLLFNIMHLCSRKLTCQLHCMIVGVKGSICEEPLPCTQPGISTQYSLLPSHIEAVLLIDWRYVIQRIPRFPNGPRKRALLVKSSPFAVAYIERHTVWSRSMWNHTFTYLLAALAGCCVLRGGESLRRCGVAAFPRWRCALRPLVKTQPVR